MIDILSRDGLARQLKWTAGNDALVTPGILFLEAPGIPHFERGEIFISTRGPVKDRFTISVGGSWMLDTAPATAGTAIPPFPNIPAGLEGAPGEAYAASLESFGTAGSMVLGVPGVHPSNFRQTGAEVIVFGSALELSYQPRRFAQELVELRKAASYGRAIYAPGLGEPGHLALLAYCGLDLFDSSPMLAAARRGVRLFPGWKADASEKGVCHCPACEGGSGGFDAVYRHNCFSALSECVTVRAAVRQGRLRELAETRLSEPWMVAMLRHMDLRHEDFCERYFPIARPASSGGLLALGRSSLTRPEVARFRNRVLERCRRPPSAPVLLLLPCSARKPYSMSRSHRIFRSWTDRCGNPGTVHEVVVTSPLGVVPMELESLYPAGSYDIPVTGDWDEQEKKTILEQLRRFVLQGGYSHVVCHLAGMDFLTEALPASSVFTGGKHSAHSSSLEAMLAALTEAVKGSPKVGGRLAQAERLASLCRFQFGDGGDALTAGCDVRRFGPELRFILPDRQHTQVGMLAPERGLVSITLAGGGRLAGRTDYEVEIDDFMPSGTVFAPGVLKAGRSIRPGDEVVIVHKGRLRGVGVAVMGGQEMSESDRGAAVKVRHHVTTARGGNASEGRDAGGGGV